LFASGSRCVPRCPRDGKGHISSSSEDHPDAASNVKRG
jgi:hypothetical protein